MAKGKKTGAAARKPAPAKTARRKPVKTAAKRVARPIARKPAAKPKPKPVAKKTAAKAAAAKVVTMKAPPAPPRPAPVRRKAGEFSVNDYIVYPTHGVGRIRAIEEQEFAGHSLTLFVVEFEKEKMTLRVPIAKASATGMRKLSSPDKMKSALQTLKGRARVKRTMWSRRAQEYEAKINSGDPVSIAEVVRDLHRASGQPEQSYSERQIYENALDRLARELAAVEGLEEGQAAERLEKVLKAA